MKKFKFLAILVILIYSTLFFTSYRPLLPGYHFWYYTPPKYRQLIATLNYSRLQIGDKYNKSRTNLEKKKIIDYASKEFQKELVNSLFPYWYGTFWTFNGRTEIPGQSSIACGYFVTTTLRDMGIKLNRTKLAQVASEEMIKSIVSSKYIKWYNKMSMQRFIADLKAKGEGVYIIGLDNHTGYIISERNKTWFIHSSGRFPYSVIKEDAELSTTLMHSKYKVVGCLSKDEKLIKKWILAN